MGKQTNLNLNNNCDSNYVFFSFYHLGEHQCLFRNSLYIKINFRKRKYIHFLILFEVSEILLLDVTWIFKYIYLLILTFIFTDYIKCLWGKYFINHILIFSSIKWHTLQRFLFRIYT